MLRRSFLGACVGCAIAAAQDPVEVLVQGAVDGELQPLLAALEGRKATQMSSWTFWEGRIGAKRVVVSRTEVGPINAVAATVLGIERYKPRLIINQGTAGAHNPCGCGTSWLVSELSITVPTRRPMRMPDPASIPRIGSPMCTASDWMAHN